MGVHRPRSLGPLKNKYLPPPGGVYALMERYPSAHFFSHRCLTAWVPAGFHGSPPALGEAATRPRFLHLSQFSPGPALLTIIYKYISYTVRGMSANKIHTTSLISSEEERVYSHSSRWLHRPKMRSNRGVPWMHPGLAPWAHPWWVALPLTTHGPGGMHVSEARSGGGILTWTCQCLYRRGPSHRTLSHA